jgi:hypothetical protein
VTSCTTRGFTDHMRAKMLATIMSDPSSPHFATTKQRLGDFLTKRAEGAVVTPLNFLGVELIQACAESRDVVSEITINNQWVAVVRGAAELDPTTFRIADHYTDEWKWMPG